MDPSAAQCLILDNDQVYDSLRTAEPAPTESFQWYSTEPTLLTPRYNTIGIDHAPSPQYGNIQRYQTLLQVKDAFANEGFVQARDNTNPFENIGRSIFINRAAIKIANIDAVHKIAGVFSYDQRQSNDQLVFCDVAAGPGGFTQYIQYRYPQAQGYGMTLAKPGLDWSTKFIDMSRFDAYYGPDNTGNLYTNYEHFISRVLSKQPAGVNLVMGDGGFDLEESDDKTLLHRQEFLSSRLLLTQALIGVACTGVHGNFVLKVFDTVTEFSAHVLYVLAQCFERIQIFKPVSSRPANAERYVICWNRRPEVQSYYTLLYDAAGSYTDQVYLSTLFDEALPKNFIEWLTTGNNQSIDRQLNAARNILQYMNGTMPDLPVYDTNKFLIIWNLPDTPPRRSNIRVQ